MTDIYLSGAVHTGAPSVIFLRKCHRLAVAPLRYLPEGGWYEVVVYSVYRDAVISLC